MSQHGTHGPKPARILVSKVNFLWYLVAIVPILVLFYLGGSGILPSWMAVVAFFAFFMWLFSLIFALISVLRATTDDKK